MGLIFFGSLFWFIFEIHEKFGVWPMMIFTIIISVAYGKLLEWLYKDVPRGTIEGKNEHRTD